MSTLYINKNADKAKTRFAILWAGLSVLFLEGLRAGLVTHLTRQTPELLGFIPTSPIEPQIALYYVIPGAGIGLLFFLYSTIAILWKGVLKELSMEGDYLKTTFNGFANKEYQYDLNKIKKVAFKSIRTNIPGNPPGQPVTQSTTIHSEVIYITYKMDNGKQKKVELVNGEKKEIRAIGKIIKENIS